MKFFLFKRKKEKPAPVYNRFVELKKRLVGSPFYADETSAEAPLGYFDGRPIICETNKLIGGVYLSLSPCEAIVIDEKYGELTLLYDELVRKYVSEVGSRSLIEDKIFPLVTNFVQAHLRFDPIGLRNLSDLNEITADHKISLDFFVKKHVGVSRHQVLCAAFLLHKLRERGLISGDIKLDPFYEELPADNEALIYINPEGKQFVFNPLDEAEKASARQFYLQQGEVELSSD